MFDVGFWELALIFGVGLLILGPERMPRVASQLGRWVGRARRTASTLRRQLEQEIASADAPPPPPRKPKPLTPVNAPTSAAKDDGQTNGDGNAGDNVSVNEDVNAESNANKKVHENVNAEAPASAGGNRVASTDDKFPGEKTDKVTDQSADDS